MNHLWPQGKKEMNRTIRHLSIGISTAMITTAMLTALPVLAHPTGEVTNAVAAHLALHRVEHLVAIKKLDPSFEKAFKKVTVEAMTPATDADPAFRTSVSQYKGADGAANRVEILLDKKGKSVKETVMASAPAEGVMSWPNEAGITLTELAIHSVLDAVEGNDKLDEFVDGLTEVELSQITDGAGKITASVDFRSAATKQTYRVILATDGKVMSSAFVEESAKTDNALTQEELLKVTKLSMDDYTTEYVEHAKHLSGFKVSTVGMDAKVTLSITHDGMTMTANYFCVRQEATFVCKAQ